MNPTTSQHIRSTYKDRDYMINPQRKGRLDHFLVLYDPSGAIEKIPMDPFQTFQCILYVRGVARFEEELPTYE
jgi:hypothetical protein